MSSQLFILAVRDPGWPSVVRSPWRHWCTACSASPGAQYMAGMLTTIVHLRSFCKNINYKSKILLQEYTVYPRLNTPGALHLAKICKKSEGEGGGTLLVWGR